MRGLAGPASRALESGRSWECARRADGGAGEGGRKQALDRLASHPGLGPPSAAGILEQLVEQKLTECIHGLGRRESANLYDLLIGLVERPLPRAVRRETGGNQLRAAALLRINRNTLRKKLRQLGLTAGADG
jgi:two-component system, NtrC family, nitrogen regulation response regulator GlnG